MAGLFVISMILAFPFPHNRPFGEAIFSFFQIPLEFGHGFQTVGIMNTILFFTSIFLLIDALEKYRIRFVLLLIIAGNVVPAVLVDTYQSTLASGIYAVTYQKEESNCEFNRQNGSSLHATCTLPFVNHSNEAVQFSLDFTDRYEEEVRMVTLLNENGPYQVAIQANEYREITIDTVIDVSQIENAVESGSSSFLSIEIHQNQNTRNL